MNENGPFLQFLDDLGLLQHPIISTLFYVFLFIMIGISWKVKKKMDSSADNDTDSKK